MTRCLIIVNPVAGRGSGETTLPLITQAVQDAGLDCEIVRTERPWHAAELAEEAPGRGFDVVAYAGGDGTLNEVINGLMNARLHGRGEAALAALPVGRGNDFAFSMGAAVTWQDGVHALVQNKRKRIDIGRVTGGLYPQGRYFGNGVGIGFDAVVGFEALKLKRLSGFPSYIVAALKTIFLYFHAPTAEIQLDSETITQPCLMISVMNGIRLGGGFFMAPDSKPDDGVLDLCIVHEVSIPKTFGLIAKFMKGTQGQDKAVRFVRTRTLNVTALAGSQPVHADGETICTEGKTLSIELLPSQLELLVM